MKTPMDTQIKVMLMRMLPLTITIMQITMMRVVSISHLLVVQVMEVMWMKATNNRIIMITISSTVAISINVMSIMVQYVLVVRFN